MKVYFVVAALLGMALAAAPAPVPAKTEAVKAKAAPATKPAKNAELKNKKVLAHVAGKTTQKAGEPCEEALEVSEAELAIQLDYLSRRCEMVYYDNAMKIYGELKKQGKDPKMAVNTWELYDQAFPFVRVRKYDLVMQHMDEIQHFQDNLNQNFTNGKHIRDFLTVCNEARTALNEKYDDGEFQDPANYDPQEDHPVTWSTVKL